MQILSNPPNPAPAGLMDVIAAAGHFAAFSWDAQRNVVWECDDAAAVQAIINGYVGSASELQYHQQQKLDALSAQYAALIAAGFNYTGPDSVKRSFQIDPASQQNIDAMSNAALGAALNNEAWSPSFYWVASDNTRMILSTAQAMRAFGVAAKTYVSALFATYQSLRSQITTATTVAQVDAINVVQNWPNNP